MTFSNTILHWYSLHKRSLPWRLTQDPYKVWLSEIILQQTRVVQGTPYYLSFVKMYPSVFDLANAKEEEVLKLWQGLGYYSRARNLHAAAKMVVNDYKGVFPTSYKELLKLKGVGDYTASAISSFCFNEKQAVVDGNVYRVLARYFGVDLPINESKGIKYFKELAFKIMSVSKIGEYNQAIMEFGALQCTPQKPDCTVCNLASSCVALKNSTVNVLPVKIKKIKIKKRFFNFIVPLDQKNKTLLQKREGKGIWENLYQFPLVETLDNVSLNSLANCLKEKEQEYNTKNLYQYNDNPIVHKLSHQHLYTTFWIAKTNTDITDGIDWEEIDRFPVPVLVADFIKKFKV